MEVLWRFYVRFMEVPLSPQSVAGAEASHELDPASSASEKMLSHSQEACRALIAPSIVDANPFLEC